VSAPRRVALAITGASGACYGLAVLARLVRAGCAVHLMITDAGREVLAHEEGIALDPDPSAWPAMLAARAGWDPAAVRGWAVDDWHAPPASGSGGVDAMIVAPCSMGTLARIAHGMSTNLVERAADVMLKERRPLVLVPRETPLSAVQLRNMLALAEAGAAIAPACPGFYHRPRTIADLVRFVAERALRLAGVGALSVRWGKEDRDEGPLDG